MVLFEFYLLISGDG